MEQAISPAWDAENQYPRQNPDSHTADGDSHLSAMDRKLWALTYACIERFHCTVIFKHSGPNVPHKVNCRIEFFVPSEHPSASEVVQFLMTEMAHEAHPPSNGKDGWFWGTDVYVREYSGLRVYVDQAEIRALTMRVLQDMGHDKKA